MHRTGIRIWVAACCFTFVFSCGLSAQTTPVWGFADVHNHQFSDLGFGGLVLWGKPFDPNGISGALPHCDFAWQLDGADLDAVTPFGLPVLPTPLFGIPVHGGWGLSDAIGIALEQGLGHNVGGYPEFDGWPRWSSATHQQVYNDWLYRAHQGGLQLIVMHAVNNEIFCRVSNQRSGFGCNDMTAAVRQIEGAKTMEAFIDNEYAQLGLGEGWYRIVYTPQQARDAIAKGQLAVVLGIEVDNLFGCTKNGTTCDDDTLRTNLKAYYDIGVRHLFPIHVFDNGFGGAALYNDAFNKGNRIMTGDWLQAWDCSGDGIQFQFDHPTLLGDLISNVLLSGAPPVYSGKGQCNTRGLTDLGKSLVKKMMALKMIIDIDHMSMLTTDDTLGIAEAEQYPVVSGHTGFVEVSKGKKRHEGQKTATQMDRLQRLTGSLVAPILEQGTTLDEEGIASFIDANGNAPLPAVCSKSSNTWAQAYLYAITAMKGAPVALGSDFNGMAGEPGPRFGAEACTGGPPLISTAGCVGSEGFCNSALRGQTRVTYPFTVFRDGLQLDKSIAGNPGHPFDINTDGLAHIGMLPDFIQDLRNQGVTDAQLTPLFRSAEAYIQLWEKIQGSSHFPPSTRVTQQPVANSAGWNTSDVTLTFHSIGDPDGWPVDTVTYAANGAQTIPTTSNAAASAQVTINVEGTTAVTYHASDGIGNDSPTGTVSVRIDKTAPVVNCGTADNDWHASDVSIACTASDVASGLANPPDGAFTLSTNVSSGSETDNAATNSRVVYDVVGYATPAGPISGNKIDKTAPVITITQPTATPQYPHSATLTLNFSVTDTGSGVKSSTLKMDGLTTLMDGTLVANNLTINLLTQMSLGPHTFSVDSLDNVNNAGTNSVTFSVVGTAESIKMDVTQFLHSGVITNSGNANSLLAKLDAAAAARAIGQCSTAANIYQAFVKEVQTLSGKKIDPTAAQIMIADAQYLIAHCP